MSLQDTFRDLLIVEPTKKPKGTTWCECQCGWSGTGDEGVVETDGEWETGYYDILVCPNTYDDHPDYEWFDHELSFYWFPRDITLLVGLSRFILTFVAAYADEE